MTKAPINLLRRNGGPIRHPMPLEFEFPPLAITPRPVSWSRWCAGAGGSPLPWTARRGDALAAQDDRTSIQIVCDRDELALWFRSECDIVFSHPHTDVHILLDAQRDHRTCLALLVKPDGSVKHEIITAMRGELSWDHFAVIKPARRKPVVKTRRIGKRWCIGISCPLHQFKSLRGRPNVGVNIRFNARTADGFTGTLLLTGDGREHRCPWRFADLPLIDVPLRVRSIRFDSVNHFEIPLAVAVTNITKHPVDVQLRTIVSATEHRDECAVAARIPAGKRRDIETFIRPCPRQYKDQTLDLMLNVEGRAIWSGRYKIGSGIAPTQIGHVLHLRRQCPPQGWAHDLLTNDEPYFAKQRSILDRVPHFHREPDLIVTQRLVSEDGRIAIDLTRPDALGRIGAAFRRRFPDEAECLAALSVFVHQSVAYSIKPVPIADHVQPLEMLRMGATICSGFALILNGILETMGYRAWYQNSGVNHVITGVRLGRRSVLLDPTFGIAYWDAPCRRLADRKTLEQNPQLVKRAILGRNDVADLSKFYALPW